MALLNAARASAAEGGVDAVQCGAPGRGSTLWEQFAFG